MWDPLDRLGVIVMDAGFASIALLSIVTVAMSVSRQPARRLRLAHAAMFGLLAFLPLIGLRLVPRFDVLAYVSGLGILPHPVLTPATGMLDSLARTGIAFGPWPLRVIVLLYGVGVVVGLFWLVLGHAAVLWIERGSTIPSSSAVELFESLPFAAGRRKPSLRVTSRVRRPMVVGTFRPMILIPADLDGAGMEATNRLKLCLLHELAHVEASDPWFRLIGNVARVFWYFLPPLWWISSQVRLDQEFLADRKAALRFGPFRVYASSLVELATVPVAAVKFLPARRVRGGELGSPLFQRVVMLLRCPFPLEPNPPSWWSLGVPCLAIFLTLGVSTLAIRPPHAHPALPPRTHQFSLGKLELPPAIPSINGRSPVFALPIRLPDRFDLSMEVWGDLTTLSRVRVAGLLLQSPIKAKPEAGPSDRETWHTVRILSDRGVITLRIDDVSVDLFDPKGRNYPELTPSLSVESAPDFPGFIQNLVLTW